MFFIYKGENMELKEKLNNLFLNKKTLSLKLDRLSELNKKAIKLDMNSDSQIFLKNEISILSKSLMGLSNEIKTVETVIGKLNQPSRLILTYRYEKNMSMGEIAYELNYSTKRIYQLHTVALKEFNDKYYSEIENERNF